MLIYGFSSTRVNYGRMTCCERREFLHRNIKPNSLMPAICRASARNQSITHRNKSAIGRGWQLYELGLYLAQAMPLPKSTVPIDRKACDE